ncbi:MAG: hypothetical protein HZB38_18550 [Planctomycetes bacterium]|nr:hypothetical protein [Planctomycetota bacterium]
MTNARMMAPSRNVAARRAPRCGFALGELMVGLIVAGTVVTALWMLMTRSMYLTRIAAQHQARVVAIESLNKALRADVRAATQAELFDGSGFRLLRLTGVSGESGDEETVTYRISPEEIIRRSIDGETQGWSAQRLTFRVEITPAGGRRMLLLTFEEQPPPRGEGLKARARKCVLLLPAARAAAAQDEPPTGGAP